MIETGTFHRAQRVAPPSAAERRPAGEALRGSALRESQLNALWNDAEALLAEYARSRDQRVRQRLVDMHEGLCRALAVRFEGRGWTSTEDLVQVARLGLLSAIDGFNPERRCAFSTFAVPTIVGFIKHYLRDHTWGIKAPRFLRELGYRVRLERERLEQSLGRSPTMPEIARAVGATEEQLVQAMELERSYQFASLSFASEDAEGEEYSPRMERMGSEDPGLEAVERREQLRAAMAGLEERLRVVLQARYYEGLTQSLVAERLGISQMHVSRLERKALDQLRELLGSVGG